MMHHLSKLRQGQLVQDKSGNQFTIDRFYGEYCGHGKPFKWRVWVKSISNPLQIPVQADPEELQPITIN